MPGLVPGIHVFFALDWKKQDVDGRVKPGHDETGVVSAHGTHQAPLAFRPFWPQIRTGRLAVDEPLANRVRSGRKQP